MINKQCIIDYARYGWYIGEKFLRKKPVSNASDIRWIYFLFTGTAGADDSVFIGSDSVLFLSFEGLK